MTPQKPPVARSAAERRPSTLRVIGLSWWVLYRVTRNRLRRSSGRALSILFVVIFLGALTGQVATQAVQQRHLLQALIGRGEDGLRQAAGQAAALFLLDVLGLLLLLPPAMIRADGIVGKQRAAVDTELWLTLPLSGRQQLAARLAQATFFLSFLGLFFLSHFIGPALSFAPSALQALALFLVLTLTAALCVLGGGVGLYALVRRYLRPQAQGRLVAWSGFGIVPILYASFALTGRSGRPGGLAAWLATQAAHTPLAALFAALQHGPLRAALTPVVLLLGCGVMLAALGWRAVEVLGREAVDDLAPLGAVRRYPTRRDEDQPLSHLAKDLRLRLRDPMHRGAVVSTLITAFAIVVMNLVVPGAQPEALSGARDSSTLLMMAAILCGITTLLSASQWVPLEARALEFLRVSGIEPPWLVVHKGLCASVEALLLCVPACAALLIWQGLGRAPAVLEIALLAVAIAWFVVGDSAARFPEARRDTRPFQVRTFLAAYLLSLAGGVALSISHAAAAAALVVLGMGALGRTDAGIDALTYLDDSVDRAARSAAVIDRPRRVRFADAWLAGGAAALVQALVAVILSQVLWHGRLPLIGVLIAYSASALLLGVWSLIYLRRRLPPAESLLGAPAGRAGYVWGLGLGLLSVAAAALYLFGLRRFYPAAAADGVALWTGGARWARWLAALVVVLLDPLAEEIFFRGWVLRGLEERLRSPRWALLLQAVLFAMLHPALSYVPVGVLGLCAGLAVQRTGSLRPAVLVHAIHNALPALLLCLPTTTIIGPSR